jgi:hypothetical protein
MRYKLTLLIETPNTQFLLDFEEGDVQAVIEQVLLSGEEKLIDSTLKETEDTEL